MAYKLHYSDYPTSTGLPGSGSAAYVLPVAYAVRAPLIAAIQGQCTDHQKPNRPTLIEQPAAE